MNPYATAFAGGVLGAVLMDLAEMQAARAGIRSGVDAALLGRWCAGLARGRWRHADIARSRPVRHEAALGWAFHLLVGGGVVALPYALLSQLPGAVTPAQHVLGGLLYGLATSLLPWCLLLPSFGWGWFGRRGPPGTRPLLASPLSHLPYGLGVGLAMALAAQHA